MAEMAQPLSRSRALFLYTSSRERQNHHHLALVRSLLAGFFLCLVCRTQNTLSPLSFMFFFLSLFVFFVFLLAAASTRRPRAWQPRRIPCTSTSFACVLVCVSFSWVFVVFVAGVKPARRISAVATALLYSFAVAFPVLHNYVMANIGL